MKHTTIIPKKCHDCGQTIPLGKPYQLRRNSEEHMWEPICPDCSNKMVLKYGKVWGDITITDEGAEVSIHEEEGPQ